MIQTLIVGVLVAGAALWTARPLLRRMVRVKAPVAAKGCGDDCGCGD